ncbi:MAG TPA: HAMP domain-containing sensor histidine kinase [Thermomicrobiales bacterium]|nr:HAMP domain-containing sensor histidine kinase [Thermomicrobiales bacterium]
MNRLWRPTIRLRLTLFYGGLFLVSGAILLVLMYVLLSQNLQPPPPKPPHDTVVQVEGPTDEEPSFEEQLADARKQERENALSQIRIVAAGALVVTSVGALGLGWVASGRVLRPIRDITDHARQASETSLDRRIALQGPDDELMELANTIDAMLARLQAAFESQRRFAAQASHELRTPLAIMGAEADVALGDKSMTGDARDLALAIRKQVTRSERLVQGLLTLSRSESTMRDDIVFDLADLAGDIVGDYLTLADAENVRINLELDEAHVKGDPVLLGPAIGNLVENAIRYNVPGGFVHIAAGVVEGQASVKVENSGRVIDPDELATMIRPFRRGLDQATRRAGGFGLGLAIVRSVTATHGGHLEIQRREEGGLLIRMSFPLNPTSA